MSPRYPIFVSFATFVVRKSLVEAAGHFVPPAFRRVNSEAGHADDVFVHDNGLVFASSSDPGGGLWIMRYTPGVKGTVSWTPDNTNVTVKYDKRPEN